MQMQFRNICLFVFATFCLGALSCQSKQDPVPNDPLRNNYLNAIQLKPGSFWIYSNREVSLEDSSSFFQMSDSTYIKDYETIDGVSYALRETNSLYKEYLKVSNGNVIDWYNETIFSGIRFGDTIFRDDIKEIVSIMTDIDKEVIVPAGKFKTVTYIKLIKGRPHVYLPNDPTIYNNVYMIGRKVYYANGIGIVKSEDYYGGRTVGVKELLRFNISKN